MNQVKRIQSLFNQFAMTIGQPTDAVFNNETKRYNRQFLKLDFNSTYGGYRIDWVNKDTGESFFNFSSRFSNKEMSAYLQGLIEGYQIKKANL